MDLDGSRPAYRLDLAFLQNTQQLGLKGRRRVGNLIKENRAAVGLVEQSSLVRHCPGKGSLHMSKQLTFEQRLRQ